jgi:transposase
VIQAPKLGVSNHYELADHEWAAIKPMLSNKPRGVPRVNDRRIFNGIFWVLRSGAPWRDLPKNFGPYTTCYNRFVRVAMAPSPTKAGQGEGGSPSAMCESAGGLRRDDG